MTPHQKKGNVPPFQEKRYSSVPFSSCGWNRFYDRRPRFNFQNHQIHQNRPNSHKSLSQLQKQSSPVLFRVQKGFQLGNLVSKSRLISLGGRRNGERPSKGWRKVRGGEGAEVGSTGRQTCNTRRHAHGGSMATKR